MGTLHPSVQTDGPGWDQGAEGCCGSAGRETRLADAMKLAEFSAQLNALAVVPTEKCCCVRGAGNEVGMSLKVCKRAERCRRHSGAAL